MILNSPLTIRLVRSALNRGRQLAMLTRGAAARAVPGLLAGGKALGIGRNVDLVVYGELIVGNNVILSDGCAIEVGPRARLVLGDRVLVGRHSVIAAHDSIEIGDGTLIAEHCTIRDQDHQLDPEVRRRETTALTSPVALGSTVWIGAGARVLRGSRIGDGSVVAANAVVRGEVPAGVVVGGIPARILRPLSRPLAPDGQP